MLAEVKADSTPENSKSVSCFSPRKTSEQLKRVYLPAGLGWKWPAFQQPQKAAFIPNVCS